MCGGKENTFRDPDFILFLLKVDYKKFPSSSWGSEVKRSLHLVTGSHSPSLRE
jgi:hypothetical protein